MEGSKMAGTCVCMIVVFIWMIPFFFESFFSLWPLFCLLEDWWATWKLSARPSLGPFKPPPGPALEFTLCCFPSEAHL